MIRFTAQTAFVCLITLAAAGCAVEVPMSAFRVGPTDAAQSTDAHSQRHQDVKQHISIP